MPQSLFLHESGSHLAIGREYGRCLSHQRLVCSRPYPRGHKYSIISAVSNRSALLRRFSEWRNIFALSGALFSAYTKARTASNYG